VENTGQSVKVTKPEFCPFCGSVIVETGANPFCPNKKCKPRVVATLAHFASKGAMDIEGFSEATATLLYEKSGVDRPSRLYSLNAEELSGLDGFKDKKISNLLNAINASRNITLDRFIFALGIDGVGKVASKALANAFASIENLSRATVERLIQLDDVGEITAAAIVGWFAEEDNKTELEKLLSYITCERVEKRVSSGIFTGQSVVLTGTLSAYKRSEAQKIIEDNGGECQSSVTAKTTLVIAGEAAGSKLEKAQKLGIKIIDEARFVEMIKG